MSTGNNGRKIPKPKLVLGNANGGGHVLGGKMRMFRMGHRHLSSYEYNTLDIQQCKSSAIGGNKHIEVDEIERFFDRAGKGKPGATITDPRMSTGAYVFIPMEKDPEYPYRYYIRSFTDDMVSRIDGGYRAWGVMDVEQESTSLVFKLTQMEAGREAYYDNSRFMVSNILWEFSPDGGRGKWYQLYELPNEKVRISLPEPTQQIKVRAISNNPEEWVQAIAITPRTDFQNRYADELEWVLDGESDIPDDYMEFDDLGYLSWPEARGGCGDVIYTLYWEPMEGGENWAFVARTRMNDLSPDEFELPVQYAGGWLHVFAHDILSTLHIKMQFTRSIADCEVICTPDTMTYTGHAVEPDIEVRFRLDLSVLPPEFYDATFSSNVNVGQATVEVVGRGVYYGTVQEPGHFNIVPADVGSCSVTLTPSSYEYSGSACEPQVELNLNGFTVDPSDYDVEYRDNVNVGTARAIITGVGNMTGETEVEFNIGKASLSRIELESDYGTYAVDWNLPGYNVYGVDENPLDEDSYFMSIEPPFVTDAGEYVYTAVGRGDYGGEISKTYTLKSANLSNAEFSEIEAQWYTGFEIKPRPTVTRTEVLPDGTTGEKTLVEGTDFYYSWEDNVLVGTARVIITGIGNYMGQAETTFVITNELGDGDWEFVVKYIWDDIVYYSWGQLSGNDD